MGKREARRRRRRDKARAIAVRMWSVPPPRPDRPRVAMVCQCPHVWVRAPFQHGLEDEQETKTYECRECSTRLVRIADGLRGAGPEFYCTAQGSFLPCRWDGCITADRSRWRKIYDGTRAATWRSDAHQIW